MSKPIKGGSNLISLEDAIAMTSEYRKEKDSILAEGVSPDVLPICETFNKTDFQTVLDQTGCVGVRVYFGMKTGKEISVVVVGVNADDEDMISTVNPAYADKILDMGNRCPIVCPPKSDLN